MHGVMGRVMELFTTVVSDISNNFRITWLKQEDLSFSSGEKYNCSLPITINKLLAVAWGYSTGYNYHYYQPCFEISSTNCNIHFWPTDPTYQPQTSTVGGFILILAT